MGTGNCHITGPPPDNKDFPLQGPQSKKRASRTDRSPCHRWVLGPTSTAQTTTILKSTELRNPTRSLVREDAEADIRTAQVVSTSEGSLFSCHRVSPSQEILWMASRGLSWRRVLVPHTHLGSLALPDGYSQDSESKPSLSEFCQGVLLLQIAWHRVCHWQLTSRRPEQHFTRVY